MIESEDAIVAIRTMRSPRRPDDIASAAPLVTHAPLLRGDGRP